MSYHRGDVVIMNAPFVNRPGSKLRPMLVVQCDRNNGRMTNTILVTITTNLAHSHEPTRVIIDVNSPDGKQSGLIATSVVSCENLLTVDQTQVVRKIGSLPASLMQAVDAALKSSLELT